VLVSRIKYYAGFLILADVASIVVVFIVTYFLRNSLIPLVLNLPPLFPWENYLPILIFLVPAWLSSLFWFEGYSFSPDKNYLPWAFDLSLKTTIVGIMAIGAYLFISKSTHISRTFVLLCAVGIGLAIFFIRFILFVYILKVGKNPHFSKNLLVVGTKSASEKMVESIKSHVHWGLNIQTFIEIEDADGGNIETHTDGKLGEVLNKIERFLHTKKVIIDEVIVCLPRSQILKFEPINRICCESGVRVSLICDLFPTHNPQIQVTTLHGLGMITIDPSMGREFRYFLKRMMDLVLASALLVIISPLIVVVSIMIKLTSKGPVLFHQTRVGLKGRHFQMYKFRTMVEGSDAQRDYIQDLNVLDGPVFKALRDPRLTPIGGFLRRAFIDEILQLFNVIRGEMSLVGPRPPLPSEVEKYKLWHSKRLSMKPGITGLWQISGRSKFVSFEEWMLMDLEYIEGWSLWLDTKILLRTIPEVLRFTGV
jgi:exopolysaccharide biosynthesis polyprenyl glycosylphosphotransferase